MAVTAKAARGAARKARRRIAPIRPALASGKPSHGFAARWNYLENRQTEIQLFRLSIRHSAASAALRPAAMGGALRRQTAWGLLRDQISVCVPSSSSIRRA